MTNFRSTTPPSQLIASAAVERPDDQPGQGVATSAPVDNGPSTIWPDLPERVTVRIDGLAAHTDVWTRILPCLEELSQALDEHIGRAPATIVLQVQPRKEGT